MGMNVATKVTSGAAEKPSMKRQTKIVRPSESTCEANTHGNISCSP